MLNPLLPEDQQPWLLKRAKRSQLARVLPLAQGRSDPKFQGCTMKVPVAVIRLPHGPDGSSRGFDPNSPRFQALGPASLSSGSTADLEQEQQSRVMLRERYLRSLLAMAGQPVRFTMYERVKVTALFGTSDIDILNFQVSELQTPLGIQREALLRCSDIIAYSFEL
ncbi:gem-associated protein 7 isoform X1 [Zootoca vivipara]|uniref:gem-associated protein 7 isoform X1 n=1 Tax=Zootoca vivipara TaxID=8524 RepID=UPI0015907630|nr:gem-associated protein 7 isoform X1 [Zootoca vivipara]